MIVENTINSLKSKMKVAYNDILFLFRFLLFPFLMVQGERDVHSRQGEPVRRMAVWVDLPGQGAAPSGGGQPAMGTVAGRSFAGGSRLSVPAVSAGRPSGRGLPFRQVHPFS